MNQHLMFYVEYGSRIIRNGYVLEEEEEEEEEALRGEWLT
jgi:hypothetical protein